MFRAFGPILPLQTLQSIGNSFVHLKFAHVASIQLPAAILALQFWSPAKISMTYCKMAKASLLHCHKWWSGISIPSASHFSHCAYKGRDIFTVQHGSYCCDSLYVYWISWSLLEITTTIKAHRVIARNTIHHKEGNLEVVMNLIYDHLPQFIFRN